MANAPKRPAGWGEDELSRYLDLCLNNSAATCANLRTWWDMLCEVDSVFATLCANAVRVKASFYLFVFPAHAAYRAATGLATSGQFQCAFMVLRGCLEHALYALHTHKNPSLLETWLRRSDSKESARAVRKAFTAGAVLETLEAADTEEGRVARKLYEHAIEYGAHPNERGVLTGTVITDAAKGEAAFNYFTVGDVAHEACLKLCATTGVCSLNIFRLLCPERFDILGLTERLRELKSKL